MTTTTVTPRLAHIVLQTNRLTQMRDWYSTILGAHVVYETPNTCFLTFDDEHHRLALVSSPAEPFAERNALSVGLQHTAFTFPSIETLLDKFAQLRTEDIEPAVPIQHGVTTSLYYRDPDGNFVELQVDNFVANEAASAYMAGPEYSADHVGPSFDPDAMAAALAAGVSTDELMTREWAVRAGPPIADPMMALLGGA